MTVTIHVGDAREVLRSLPAESVHCVVTSPPYWGLRAYGGDEGMIGLEKTFEEHLENLVGVFREVWRVLRKDGTVWLNYGDAYASSPPGNKATGLKKWKTSGLHGGKISAQYAKTLDSSQGQKRNTVGGRFKPKDLMGMPWRVAFTLQEDGWFLRSANVWHKRNPMPESAKDRPTSAYDMFFQLTKVGTGYFYDREAVMTDASENTHARRKDGQYLTRKGADPNNNRPGSFGSEPYAGKRAVTGLPLFGEEWVVQARQVGKTASNGRQNKRKKPRGQPPYHEQYDTGHQGLDDTPRGKANLRNVWSIATRPFKGAHFATFPPDVVETPVKASTSARGCCPDCGTPWERCTSTTLVKQYETRHGGKAARGGAGGMVDMSESWSPGTNRVETLGWRPRCNCYDERYREVHPEPKRSRKRQQRAMWDGRWKRVRARPGLDEWGPWVPAVVLDPFAGSGTVGLVAGELGRDAILIEISAKYAAMARRRTAVIQPPLFPEEA